MRLSLYWLLPLMAGSYIVSASLVAAASRQPQLKGQICSENIKYLETSNFVTDLKFWKLPTWNWLRIRFSLLSINYFHWSLLVFLSPKQT